jgi:hypothetical protein
VTANGALGAGSDPSAISVTLVAQGQYRINFSTSGIVACPQLVNFDQPFPLSAAIFASGSLKEVVVTVFDAQGGSVDTDFKLTMLC